MKIRSSADGIQNDFLMADGSFLRDFFENSPIGFHVFGPDKIIQAINQAELDMLGYQREEIVGRKKWSDLIIREQHPLFERHWKDILSVGRARDLRYTLQTKSGGKVDVILNASARFDASRKLINTRGTVLDITYFSKACQDMEDMAVSLKKQKETLEQHNQALNVLLANIEIEKQNMKSSVSLNLERLILPVLKKMKRRGSALDQRYLELLENNLHDLTSTFGSRLVNPRWKLTTREIEVCNMIKNGLATRAIADMLCVSERTVEHHRNHIRQKLGLAKNNINLGSYLQSL